MQAEMEALMAAVDGEEAQPAEGGTAERQTETEGQRKRTGHRKRAGLTCNQRNKLNKTEMAMEMGIRKRPQTRTTDFYWPNGASGCVVLHLFVRSAAYLHWLPGSVDAHSVCSTHRRVLCTLGQLPH